MTVGCDVKSEPVFKEALQVSSGEMRLKITKGGQKTNSQEEHHIEARLRKTFQSVSELQAGVKALRPGTHRVQPQSRCLAHSKLAVPADIALGFCFLVKNEAKKSENGLVRAIWKKTKLHTVNSLGD